MKKVIVLLFIGIIVGIGIAFFTYFRLYKTTEYIRIEYSPPYIPGSDTANFRASYTTYNNDSVAYYTEYDRTKKAYEYISRHFSRLKPTTLDRDGIKVYQEEAKFLYDFLNKTILLIKVTHTQDWRAQEFMEHLNSVLITKDKNAWVSYLKENKIQVKKIEIWHTNIK